MYFVHSHGNLNVEVDLDPDELQKIDPYTLDVFRIDRTIDLSFLRKYFNLGIGFHKYEKLPNVHVEYDSVHDAIDEFERAQQAIGDRVLVQFKRTPADPMLVCWWPEICKTDVNRAFLDVYI